MKHIGNITIEPLGFCLLHSAPLGKGKHKINQPHFALVLFSESPLALLCCLFVEKEVQFHLTGEVFQAPSTQNKQVNSRIQGGSLFYELMLVFCHEEPFLSCTQHAMSTPSGRNQALQWQRAHFIFFNPHVPVQRGCRLKQKCSRTEMVQTETEICTLTQAIE